MTTTQLCTDFTTLVARILAEEKPPLYQETESVLIFAWPAQGIHVRLSRVTESVSLILPGMRSCWRYTARNWERLAEELLLEILATLDTHKHIK